MHFNSLRILNIGGRLLLLTATFMLPSALIGLYYKEFSVLIPLGGLTVFLAVIGLIVLRFCRPESEHLKSRDIFFMATMFTLLVSFICGLPYLLTGILTSPIDAIFEGVSGITTTGATVLTDLSPVPKSLLFWRSTTGFLGGFLSLLVFIKLFSPAGSAEKRIPAKRIFAIMFSLVAAEAMFLLVCGINIFDAIAFSMSTISTTGFSSINGGVAALNNGGAFIIIGVFMFVTGINYCLFCSVFTRRNFSFIANGELQFYIKLTAILSVLLFAGIHSANMFERPLEAFWISAFTVVSSLSTTGFDLCGNMALPTLGKLLIPLMFLAGACTYSCGGGLKLQRLLIVFKLVQRGILIRLHPNAIINIKIKRDPVSPEKIQSAIGFVFIYIVAVMGFTALFSLNGYGIEASLHACISSISNAGAGSFVFGTDIAYTGLNDLSKGLLAFAMIVGRLEIFAVVTLFSKYFWDSKH